MNGNTFKCVIMGPPASGKHTMSTRIGQTFKATHISAGATLKKHIEKGSSLGKSAEKIYGKWMVEDEPMIEMMKLAVEAAPNLPIVISGFPRNLYQGVTFWGITKFNLAINLMVPFELLVDRAKKRWIHKPSGRVYNIDFKPPKVPFKDDETGEDLVQREDDKLANLFEKLREYEANVLPVLDFYREVGILQDYKAVNAGEIWPKIKNALENFIPIQEDIKYDVVVKDDSFSPEKIK